MPNKNKIKVVATLGEDLLQYRLHLPSTAARMYNGQQHTTGNSLFTNDTAPFLHKFASEGCSGLLHVRSNIDGPADVALLRQILGLYEDLEEELQRVRSMAANADEDAPSYPGVSCTATVTPYSPTTVGPSLSSGSKLDQRHHGMHFTLWTESKAVESWLRKDMYHDSCRVIGDITAEITAEDVLTKLYDPNVDVLLIHLGRRNSSAQKANVVKFMNELVGNLMTAYQRPDVISHSTNHYRLYLSVLASLPLDVLSGYHDAGAPPQFPSFMPMYSYRIYRGKKVDNVLDSPAIMFSSLLPDITRIDNNTKFEERSISENAGIGSILADHFFDELSYIVGYSPKYGAY